MIDIEAIFSDPNLKALGRCLEPLLPVLKRQTEDVQHEVLKYLFEGNWTAVDEKVWVLATEEERDKLDSAILADAREATQRAFENEQMFKKALFKVATSLLLAVI